MTDDFGLREVDEAGWRKHKDSIAKLVRLVDERWREAVEQPLP